MIRVFRVSFDDDPLPPPRTSPFNISNIKYDIWQNFQRILLLRGIPLATDIAMGVITMKGKALLLGIGGTGVRTCRSLNYLIGHEAHADFRSSQEERADNQRVENSLALHEEEIGPQIFHISLDVDTYAGLNFYEFRQPPRKAVSMHLSNLASDDHLTDPPSHLRVYLLPVSGGMGADGAAAVERNPSDVYGTSPHTALPLLKRFLDQHTASRLPDPAMRIFVMGSVFGGTGTGLIQALATYLRSRLSCHVPVRNGFADGAPGLVMNASTAAAMTPDWDLPTVNPSCGHPGHGESPRGASRRLQEKSPARSGGPRAGGFMMWMRRVARRYEDLMMRLGNRHAPSLSPVTVGGEPICFGDAALCHEPLLSMQSRRDSSCRIFDAENSGFSFPKEARKRGGRVLNDVKLERMTDEIIIIHYNSEEPALFRMAWFMEIFKKATLGSKYVHRRFLKSRFAISLLSNETIEKIPRNMLPSPAL